MVASEFEFRHRFWLIAAVFAVAFQCYALDHTNSAEALARLLGWPTTGAAAGVRLVLTMASVVAAVGVGARFWGAAYLGREIVHSGRLRSESLVADGPFRYVRNPLYLGTTLFTVGLGLLASRLGWLVIVSGLLLLHYRLIRREEAELLRVQGARYRAYCDRVPRLWPALRPRVKTGSARPQWRQAFFGELFMIIFLVAMIAYTLTLRLGVFAAAIGSGIGVYLVQNLTMKHRGRRSAPRS